MSAELFDEDPPRDATAPAGFDVDLPEYGGPLEVMVELARRHRLDLTQIGLVRLIEQYCAWLDDAIARGERLSDAAAHLVHAAWLVQLKSALLLPKPPAAAEELARRLASLDALRRIGDALMRQPRLGHDVFARRGLGDATEGGQDDDPAVALAAARRMPVTLWQLIQIHARLEMGYEERLAELAPRPDGPPLPLLHTVEEAILRLRERMPALAAWTPLTDLAPWESHRLVRRSSLASTLMAALELARQGDVEVRDGAAWPEVRRKR